jgi:hypothetical protein
MIAKYKHFGCADCYKASIKFVNKIGKDNLITITSNAGFDGVAGEGVNKRFMKSELVTVWYWEDQNG